MQRILAPLVAVLLLIPLFMVSAVLFAFAAVVGLGAFGWFWWHTRALRRELRARMDAQQAAQASRREADAQASGVVIEGEVIRDPAPPASRLEDKP